MRPQESKGSVEPQNTHNAVNLNAVTSADNSANASAKRAGHSGTSDNGAQPRRNTVETVFSQEAVESLENLLYDYWNKLYGICFVDNMMSMLASHIKHYSGSTDEHWYIEPEYMCRFVSNIIQLNDWLNVITNDERPCGWKDTADGWRLPVSDNQS